MGNHRCEPVHTPDQPATEQSSGEERCPNPNCRSDDPATCCMGDHNHPVRKNWLSYQDERYCCPDPFHTPLQPDPVEGERPRLDHTYTGPALRLTEHGRPKSPPLPIGGTFRVVHRGASGAEIENGEGQRWLILHADGGELKPIHTPSPATPDSAERAATEQVEGERYWIARSATDDDDDGFVVADPDLAADYASRRDLIVIEVVPASWKAKAESLNAKAKELTDRALTAEAKAEELEAELSRLREGS